MTNTLVRAYGKNDQMTWIVDWSRDPVILTHGGDDPGVDGLRVRVLQRVQQVRQGAQQVARARVGAGAQHGAHQALPSRAHEGLHRAAPLRPRRRRRRLLPAATVPRATMVSSRVVHLAGHGAVSSSTTCRSLDGAND